MKFSGITHTVADLEKSKHFYEEIQRTYRFVIQDPDGHLLAFGQN
jgi:predicted lactoylglutathione lyase